MSEQYPLLYDDLIEEERLSPQFHRRLLMSRARAKNKVKGAAAIIARWPEHWSYLLTYWWLGVGMIAVTTFFIYNFLFSYAVLQSTYTFAPKTYVKPKPETEERLKVLMHIFPDNDQELDWDDIYLPYIDILTNTHTGFQYEIIIVANDTQEFESSVDESANNDQALNTLWTRKYKYDNLSPRRNFDLKYVSLTQYLHSSPLKNYWKNLPNQFMKFLVRAISIWEKGGIAFDPILLTPQSPHSLYVNKINNILKKFNTTKGTPKIEKQRQIKNGKPARRFNNIRDIIDALSGEREDPILYNKNDQDSLDEAETNNFNDFKRRHLMSTLESNLQELESKESTQPVSRYHNTSSSDTTDKKGIFNMLPKNNLLPLFLDYLFHNNQTKVTSKTTDNSLEALRETTKNSKHKKSEAIQTLKEDDYKPVIINAKSIFETANVTTVDESLNKNKDLFDVTIDLKGYIIATDTPCHAFIGGMFSNAIHHDRSESVADFIIKELSFFCKGLLASCKGIDVVLL